MKRFLLIGTLFLAAFSVAMGQSAGPQGGAPHKAWKGGPRNPMFARMVKELGLTKEQTVRFRAAMKSMRTRMMAWRKANPNATRQQMMTKFRAMHKLQMAKLKTILTHTQFVKFQAEIKEMRAHRGNMSKKARPPL